MNRIIAATVMLPAAARWRSSESLPRPPCAVAADRESRQIQLVWSGSTRDVA